MTSAEHVHDLLAAYALGAADPGEVERAQRHLDACAECEAELASWSVVVEALAAAAPPIEPSETVRARLARALDRETATAAAPRRAWWQVVAAGLAATALVWGGWRIAELRRELADVEASHGRLGAELRLAEERLAASRSDLARLRLALEVVGAQRASAVRLAGLDPAPGAFGQTWVDPASARAAVVVAGLAPAPEGRTYQLWKIVGGTPVSAGTFDVDPDGRATVLVDGVEDPAEIDLWAVTEEPAGGVPQPTGAMVLRS